MYCKIQESPEIPWANQPIANRAKSIMYYLQVTPCRNRFLLPLCMAPRRYHCAASKGVNSACVVLLCFLSCSMSGQLSWEVGMGNITTCASILISHLGHQFMLSPGRSDQRHVRSSRVRETCEPDIQSVPPHRLARPLLHPRYSRTFQHVR